MILNNFSFSFLLLFLLISSLLILISFLGFNVKKKSLKSGNEEKKRAFECGFNIYNKKTLRMCVQFINIAILFLLVDLEIALVLPFFFNSFYLDKKYLQTPFMVLTIFLFLVFLLILEFFLGGLKWKEEVSKFQFNNKANKFGA